MFLNPSGLFRKDFLIEQYFLQNVFSKHKFVKNNKLKKTFTNLIYLIISIFEIK